MYKDNVLIDNLTLEYTGNQLKYVNDNGIQQNIYGLKDYQNLSTATSDEFVYDANGNMTKDLDRDIVTIKYNLLNLPDTVQFKTGDKIVNTYSASGQKLKSEYYTYLLKTAIPLTVSEGEINNLPYTSNSFSYSGTAYIDNKEYNCNKVFINQYGGYYSDNYTFNLLYNPEGYVTGAVIPDMNNYLNGIQYNYFRKDHLGNNREVWQAAYNNNSGVVAATTIQRTQYYPSGLPWAEGTGAGVQNKKYNGKEWIEMHGLDEYDSQARMYYPAIMRTTTIDPLAEKYYNISPYAWCGNNPVNAIDPFGMDVWTTSDPEQIRQFLNAYNSGASSFSIKGETWNHHSDENFKKDKNGNILLSHNTDGKGFSLENTYYTGKLAEGNFDFHLDVLRFPKIRALGDPDSHFGLDRTYNLYTRNEDKAAMAFYASIIGGEIFSAVSGIIWANRARIALGSINTTIKAVNMGEKAMQTANTAAYVLQNTATKSIGGSIVAGVIEGGINCFLPPDGSANFINTPYANGFSSITYFGVNLYILLRTKQVENETKK